ncbi:MAG TPA: glutamine amidotransferase [Armatimonadota bacterium]
MRKNLIWIALALPLLGLGAARAADAQSTVLVAKGFGSQTYLPDGALAAMYPQLTEIDTFLARLQTGWVLDQPFPQKLAALSDVRAVVLADVPASALNGFMGRLTLRRYVEQGGSLLVFGGPLSFGKGEIAGSFLEDILPVTVSGPWDLVKATAPAVKVAKSSPVTDGLKWTESPKFYYYHKVTAKPGAEVLLACEGAPVLVTGRYGKGRVAVVLGTFLGEPRPGETFFYQWSGYRPLLGRTLRWLFDRGA